MNPSSQTGETKRPAPYASANAKREAAATHKLRFEFLKQAISSGDRELFKTLLPLVDPKTPDPSGRTLFMFACEWGDLDTARILFPLSDPNICDQSGLNALMLATEHEHLHVVVELVDRMQVDVNLKNNLGFTAMMMACRYNYLDGVKALLDKSDCLTRDPLGFTALMHAVIYARFVPVAEALLPKSDLLAKDSLNGRTAEEWAIKEHEPEMASFLRSRREAMTLVHHLGPPASASPASPTSPTAPKRPTL